MLPHVQQGITVSDAPVARAAAAGRRWLLGVYLVIATVDAWVVVVLSDPPGGGGLLRHLVSGTGVFLTGGFALAAWIAIAMIPGVTLSVALAARSRISVPARVLTGAIAWAGWSALLFLGTALMFSASVVEPLASTGLPLLAVSGAAFAAIGLRSETLPPGRWLTTTALLIAGLFGLVSVLLAGRFPGPS
jgi:hypothetical protein